MILREFFEVIPRYVIVCDVYDVSIASSRQLDIVRRLTCSVDVRTSQPGLGVWKKMKTSACDGGDSICPRNESEIVQLIDRLQYYVSFGYWRSPRSV